MDSRCLSRAVLGVGLNHQAGVVMRFIKLVAGPVIFIAVTLVLIEYGLRQMESLDVNRPDCFDWDSATQVQFRC